ncbi:DUF2986 domain-containing protein [Shewanella sp. MBTL60-007]|uniref:DUF2986 domain-containing protein n=1 Tax=Shewanella sp. MBTL60-007 TaxID=2815911 RepID=UPI001BB9AA73|nr:DUF2986 domain-containing protein [Shewanella sp. MBTL60-007]GIU25561.1 hypothetical protein TUM3792_31400 [Shewanella sp. MBTL60-007]
MNRTKKITKKHMSKVKKANAKLNTSNKPKYISKAERERLAALAVAESVQIDSE